MAIETQEFKEFAGIAVPSLFDGKNLKWQSHNNVLFHLISERIKIEDSPLSREVVYAAVHSLAHHFTNSEETRKEFGTVTVGGKPLFCRFCQKPHWDISCERMVKSEGSR